MKVKVQGRRTIQPTDKAINDAFKMHPNPFPLSSADFAVPPVYVQLMYAFGSPAPPTTVLQETLGRALSEYREWAGRLVKDGNGRPAIVLNDKGVVWVEAIADGILVDAMPFESSPFLREFFPPSHGVPELLLIQLTWFACGGLVIGVSWHHIVADGAAFCVFMNSWSQTVRGVPIHPLPVHDRSLLTARDPARPTFDHVENKFVPSLRPSDQSSEIVMQRIHFSAELLGKIKASASQNAERPYTRFESLLAHLWTCVSAARALRGEVVTRTKIAVDGRNGLGPPLPSEYFGNAAFFACAETTVGEIAERPLQFAANLVHGALRRMDDEYMRSAMDFLELRLKNGSNPRQSTGGTVLSPHLLASSWINFPLYELDFGWGRPWYAGPSVSPLEGLLVFVPSYTNDGSVDVVVCLLEQHMAKLQQICYDL